ncbi:hypothetical protein T4A_826 [Trichinella pseudospiralis]|uniref:Uncharacterized protein n=1 Tax=Trichinella pseudospiralis TaxID=6337 RepID=A0A0V1J038_TRIPS|nr:hypothetical protein T4A_826 [Trichinella pseudospiralis]KRZ27941.1 hypothetical protein T4C_10826 [Trichinella pseudospiralis]
MFGCFSNGEWLMQQMKRNCDVWVRARFGRYHIPIGHNPIGVENFLTDLSAIQCHALLFMGQAADPILHLVRLHITNDQMPVIQQRYTFAQFHSISYNLSSLLQNTTHRGC